MISVKSVVKPGLQMLLRCVTISGWILSAVATCFVIAFLSARYVFYRCLYTRVSLLLSVFVIWCADISLFNLFGNVPLPLVGVFRLLVCRQMLNGNFRANSYLLIKNYQFLFKQNDRKQPFIQEKMLVTIINLVENPRGCPMKMSGNNCCI